MKLLIALLVFLFPTLLVPGVGVRVPEELQTEEEPVAGCNGCKAKDPAIQNTGQGSIGYEITLIRPNGTRSPGHRGLSWDKGKCTGDAAPCTEEGCDLGPGTLVVKNMETTRQLVITDRRKGGIGSVSTTINPGENVKVTYGDPLTGKSEKVSCGTQVELDIMALPAGNNTPSSRRVPFACTTCGVGANGNLDPGKPKEPV